MEGIGEVSGSLEREQVSVGVDVSRRREGILTMRKHVVGVTSSEGACLGAKVQEDGVRLPPSECPYGGLVDATDEQGGGPPPRACTVGGDAGRRDVGDVFDIGSGSSMEFCCEHGGGDLVRGTGWVKVGVQRCVGRGRVLLEVQDSALAGTNGAEGVITGESVSEGFAVCGILLVSVGKGDVNPCLHVVRGTLGSASALDGGTAEGDVAQSEGGAASPFRGRGESVLTWSA